MIIEWGRQEWNDVRQSTMKKCLQKTVLYSRDEPIEDDRFGGEELANLKTIMASIHMLNALWRSMFPVMMIW